MIARITASPAPRPKRPPKTVAQFVNMAEKITSINRVRGLAEPLATNGCTPLSCAANDTPIAMQTAQLMNRPAKFKCVSCSSFMFILKIEVNAGFARSPQGKTPYTYTRTRFLHKSRHSGGSFVEY
jgi:hypothetical protein